MLRINTLIGEDAVVVVSYTRLPFLLNSVYSLRNIEYAEGQVEIPPQRPTPPLESQPFLSPTGNLVFGGAKSISFSMGSNRSASLDQTLRATVEGDLTSTIQVKALLSDNNLPIQPEGNTQELEYLDKVFVEITGPHAAATLGDFAFSNGYSDLNAFRRELTGASGRVDFADRMSVELAGGSSKGVFRTITFRGTDQLQGPYDLLSQSGTSQEVIIAGTERIYFDGERLLRGKNRDYTIDYDNGTLTFTPRRPVTSDTEIGVDFEATQEQYDRTSVFGSGVTKALPGGFSLSGLAARERDDSDRPKSVTLSDEDRRIIEQAGDDETQALAEGATQVGAGAGDYILIPADTLSGIPEHFEFNDSIGDYSVVFVEVGGGDGDYILDGISVEGRPIYRFVDGGEGNYLVGKGLPLPQSHTVYTTRLAREGPGFLDIDLQYNVSDFDANALSPLDDDNNIGDAGEARLGVKGIPFVLGTLDVAGSMSTVQDHYRSLEKTRPWYFYKDWNLENEALEGREILQELTSSFKRQDLLRLDYSLGRIRRDNFDGVKHEARCSVIKQEDQRLSARAFVTDTEGDHDQRTREHGTLSLAYGLWKFVPSAQFDTEEYLLTSPVSADSGIAYDRYVVRVGNRRPGRFSYSIYAEERDTEELADTTEGWVATRTDRTLGGSLASRRSRSIQGEIQYTHRVRNDKLRPDTRTSDLARLTGVLRIERVGLRTNIDYEVSQSRARAQERSVVFVGEGNGDYNKLGEPVGKGRGAYTVVFLPTQKTIPAEQVDFAWNLSWKLPGKRTGSGLLSWLGANLSVNQSLNVREETVFSDAYKVYLLFPSALQRDDATLAGIVSLKQEWSLLESYPNWSLTLRYQRDDEEENRFNNVNEERFFEQQAVRVDRSLSRVLSANLELDREIRQRRGRGLSSGTGSTYDVIAWAVSAGWGLRFSAGSTLDGEVEARHQEDFESTARQVALTFRPRFVWRLTRMLNVFGRYEVTHVTLPNDPLSKPFFFSDSGTTHRWGLTPNLRFSRVISVLATYQGRSETTFSGKRIVDHELTVETRAFF